MRKAILQLHRNQQGNIGILLLLIILCLVGLIGVVWNTSELATRREGLQTAADTSAHSAATWVARCTNLVTAQNMVICQDGSAEVIWTAITPTDTAVSKRLQDELTAATAMLNGDSTYTTLRNQMLTQLNTLDNEYAMANGAWNNVDSLKGQNFSDQQQGDNFRTSVRQAGEVLSWVQNTYVNGNATDSPRHPGPPGPNGEGLRKLAGDWSPPANVVIFVQAIITSLNHQISDSNALAGFETKSSSALAKNVPSTVATHEATVFATQQQMVNQLPSTIELQRSQQSDFYKTNLTLATTGRGAQVSGPAQVQAPIVTASDSSLTVEKHYDSIRGMWVNIDPINIHANNVAGDTSPTTAQPTSPDDARIWYPDVQATVPANITAMYPGIRSTYTVQCNIEDGWGHMYGAPLKRYFNSRVANDRQGLATYMQQIDTLRKQLAETLRQLRNLPSNDNITSLPYQLTDSVADANGNYPKIPVPPRLTAPDDASDQLRAQVTLYNQHAGAYTGAVRTLASLLTSWAHYYDRFTVPFANDTWSTKVDDARRTVLKNLGLSKQFMVLATYRLRPIPDWAKSGMSVSAEASIRDRIISMNIASVSQSVLNAMVSADTTGAGSSYLDPTAKNSALTAIYSGQASQIAYSIVNSVAAQVAPVIAAEWVSRPWPYEITPPDQQVPPSRGLTREDRQTYFTLITAARPTDSNTPSFILPKLTQTTAPQLLAHAQAESFNWMEYNTSYGGGERFDEVTSDPNAYFVGCPEPWRLSTIGGWNWNSRLAVSDALSASLDASPELTTYFQEGGITNNDESSIQTLTFH